MIRIFKGYGCELSGRMAELYEDLHLACHRLDGRSISTMCTSSQISKVITRLSLDDPLIMYNIEVRYKKDIFGKTSLEIVDPINKRERLSLRNRCMDSAKDITSKCSRSHILAEKYIHDYICKNVRYDNTEPNAHSIVGPLLFKRGVCEGISKTAKILFDMLNIDSSLVLGNLSTSNDNVWNSAWNNDGHAWNKVKIDGTWFHLDITSDLGLTRKNHIRYDYFNLSDTEVSKSHSVSLSTESRCNLDKGGYYDLMGLAAGSENDLLRILESSKGDSSVTFKINATSNWSPDRNKINSLCRMFFAGNRRHEISHNSARNVYSIYL